MNCFEIKKCSRCLEIIKNKNNKCEICSEIFEDFNLYPFSTASLQINYESDFFSTFSDNRENVFGFFKYLQNSTENNFPIFQFSMTANRKNSKKKTKKKISEHGEDYMYNSALIRKIYFDPIKKTNFNTSCLIFKNRIILTLGRYSMREEVFKDYIKVLSDCLNKSFSFKIISIKNVLTNVSFTGNFSTPTPTPTPTPTTPKKIVKFKNLNKLVNPPFDLSKTFKILKPLYQTENRKILFNPILNDSNKIKIILLNNDRKKKGKISIFKSGTAMFLGFKTLKDILEEYHIIREMLKKNGYKMKEV